MVFLKEKKRTDKNIMIERDMSVIKSNLLIQKSRYSLSIQEQKIILFLISKIKPEDTGLEEYTFDIKDFCKIIGIDYKSGGNYNYIKQTILELTKKVFWIQNGDEEVTVRWLDRGKTNKGSGIIKLKLDEYLMPYLIQLKKHFTQYNLYYILAMKSQYSIRLYELLKSYQNMMAWTFSLDELKRLLNAESYDRWFNFRMRILEPAIKEIELYSDLDVSYELIKKGRAYDKIRFTIERKKNTTEVIQNVQHFFNELAPWERNWTPEQLEEWESWKDE